VNAAGAALACLSGSLGVRDRSEFQELNRRAIVNDQRPGRDVCAHTGHCRADDRALEKLDCAGKQTPLGASLSMSHMYIMRPFSGTTLSKLFSTDPTTERRIAALRALTRPPVDRNIAA
jgi:hypothetical protein